MDNLSPKQELEKAVEMANKNINLWREIREDTPYPMTEEMENSSRVMIRFDTAKKILNALNRQ